MRVQVNLSEDMVQRADHYAQKMGVSRSALCSMLIGQGIMTYDKTYDVVDAIGARVGEALVAEQKVKSKAKK